MKKNIIIIGGNAAGPAAAAKASRTAPEADILMIEREPYISTGTCELAYVISGEVDSPQKIVYFDADSFQQKKGVKVRVNTSVDSIDRRNKTITLTDLNGDKEETLAYDKLILCTGSRSVTIPPYQPDLKNVFYLKNVAGAKRILNFMEGKDLKTAAIIGAGYIGIEAAESFAQLGLKTYLLDIASQPLPQTEIEVQRLTAELIKKHNITFCGNAKEPDVTIEDNAITRIKTADEIIEPDIVLTAVGFKPENHLAESAGLEIASNGALKISNKMQTSDPHIYAAGDNVMITNAITLKQDYLPIASYAYMGGHAAGANAAGGNEFFRPIVPNVAVRVIDHFVTTVGLTSQQAEDLGYQINTVHATANSKVAVMPGNSKVFGKIIFEMESKRILGAAFFGTNEIGGYADIISLAIKEKMKVSELKEIDLNYTPPLSPFVHLITILGKKSDYA